MFCYGGLVFGDFASGALSQLLKTRLKVVRGFQLGVGFATLLYFFGARGEEVGFFYGVCFTLGFFTGYWAVLVTIAAEQFGTNLRGTVATSVPNFVRASVVPMSLALTGLKGSQGLLASAHIVGGVVWVVAIGASFFLNDTFGKDLEFFEVD